MGNILRRLTSKLIAKGASDRMEALLAPHQLGVGIKGGCEAVIHSVREAVSQNPDKWVLQVDLENAFNRVSRSHVLSEVARLLPDCLPWAVTCYGRASNLQFGKTSLSSSSGVQQGDPFASICFALVLHPLWRGGLRPARPPGFFKCGRRVNCVLCLHSENTTSYTCPVTGAIATITQHITCQSAGVYLVLCKKSTGPCSRVKPTYVGMCG